MTHETVLVWDTNPHTPPALFQAGSASETPRCWDLQGLHQLIMDVERYTTYASPRHPRWVHACDSTHGASREVWTDPGDTDRHTATQVLCICMGTVYERLPKHPLQLLLVSTRLAPIPYIQQSRCEKISLWISS